ncbi:hypothetical protein, partial [Desulfovibrio sp. An276]|uniref:hypothetical protein n=1 Tax=Desulfovibrio sp. An276 TaxID=1965618 RepID=UPI00194E9F3A
QKSESQSSLPIRYSLVNEPEPAAVSSGVGLYALFLINCQELFSFRNFFRGRISFFFSRGKVPYRLFGFHLSSSFLNFFLGSSRICFPDWR